MHNKANALGQQEAALLVPRRSAFLLPVICDVIPQKGKARMSEIPVTKIIKIDNPSEFKFHAAR